MQKGFTLTEVLVIVTIMIILIGATWSIGASYFTYIDSSRDAHREADVKGLAGQFEQYYRDNAYVSGPTYPTTAQVSTSLSSLISPSAEEATIAPDQSSSSVVVATSTSTTAPGPDSDSPDINQYVYQPLTASDALCSFGTCVRFNMYYREEKTGQLKQITSIHQQ